MSSGIKPNMRPRTVFVLLLAVSTAFSGSVALAIDGTAKPIVKNIDDANKLALALPKCFGAQALAIGSENCINRELKGLYPSIDAATSDNGIDKTGCKSMNRSEWKPKDCQIGVAGSKVRIALAGDSHMAQYRGAFVRLAKLNKWHVDLFVKGGCPFSYSSRVQDAELTASCKKWVVEVRRRVLEGKYDVVITSQSSGVDWVVKPGVSQQEAAIQGITGLWADLTKNNIPVVALKDNPKSVDKVLQCLQLKNQKQCFEKSSKAYKFDPQVAASKLLSSPLVTLVDLDRFFCTKGECKPVIGHVIVYREDSHLTNTYGLTLSPFIEPFVLEAIKK